MTSFLRRENGWNVTSFWAWPLWPATWVGYELGGSAPHQCRWAVCCLGAALSWLFVGCYRVWSFFHWPLVSSWTVTVIILGLGFLRARLLRLCCTAAFPPIFLQLRKGPSWSCAELLQSYALCSCDQCRTVKLRLPAVLELFWGMLGRGDGGWRGMGVSGSGYNEVLALEVRNVVWLRRTKETCKASSLYNGSSRVRCRAVVPGVLACVHLYILYVCVYMCMCVCMRTCIYVYVCMRVCICTSMRLYTCVCVCVCVCIFVHRLWVLVCASACGRCHACACVFVMWKMFINNRKS